MTLPRFVVGMLFIGLGFSPGHADPLASALRARDLLGAGTWSEVVRIEKRATPLAPAAIFYALIFELEDRLWFYADDSGTQSLSIYRGHLEQDKADPGPLLKEIDPAWEKFRVVMDESPAWPRADARSGELPHGCFIECVSYLRSLVEAGRAPDDARLVAYYGDAAAGARGHAVLEFTSDGKRFCFDPGAPAHPRRVPRHVAMAPLALARWSAPGAGFAEPERAVALPLHVPIRDRTPDRSRLVTTTTAETAPAVAGTKSSSPSRG